MVQRAGLGKRRCEVQLSGFPQPTSASGNVCKSDENHLKREEGRGVQALM